MLCPNGWLRVVTNEFEVRRRGFGLTEVDARTALVAWLAGAHLDVPSPRCSASQALAPPGSPRRPARRAGSPQRSDDARCLPYAVVGCDRQDR